MPFISKYSDICIMLYKNLYKKRYFLMLLNLIFYMVINKVLKLCFENI